MRASVLFGLFLSAGAVADDATLLAPTPADLAEGSRLLERRLAEAEALGEAVARLQNAWVSGGAVSRKGCTATDDLSLAARQLAFGAAWRDAAQAARAQLDRVLHMAASPTVAPLIDALDNERVGSLQAKVAQSTALYAEASAWQARVVGPAVVRCALALVPAAGLSQDELRAAGEARPAVAVSAVGGGRLCPLDVPADGRVVVLLDGRACYGASTCGCAPAPVLPGEVLGPGRP